MLEQISAGLTSQDPAGSIGCHGSSSSMDPAAWETVKDIVADALKQRPADREAFVRERCADPALRAEIEALLQHYQDASDFLEQPPWVDERGLADGLEDLQPGTQ